MAKKSQENLTNIDREHMIAEAAYFIAENRGFSAGDTEQDWYDAENKIDQFLDEQNNLKQKKHTLPKSK